MAVGVSAKHSLRHRRAKGWHLRTYYIGGLIPTLNRVWDGRHAQYPGKRAVA